jgi:hypothetical protein
MKLNFLAAIGLVAAAALPVHAQEVTLKVHFFLPPTSFASTLFIQPWRPCRTSPGATRSPGNPTRN